MSATDRLVRWGGARLSRRFIRAAPWIGTIVAVATLAATVRRKGLLAGALDAGLNAVPFIGTAKNTYEFARGRDIFPDRTSRRV